MKCLQPEEVNSIYSVNLSQWLVYDRTSISLASPIADIAEDLIILILGENLQYNVPIVPEVPI